MTSQEILAFITGIGIVPIVRVSSAESAVQAVEAIYQGGVRAAEITMTVPGRHPGAGKGGRPPRR